MALESSSLVTAAEIAQLAKVTRAAVSNWRKRYPDFPQPSSGTGGRVLYARPEVDAWLSRHGKSDDVSLEVLVWQALRSEYDEDVLSGLADICDLLLTGESKVLEPGLRSLVLDFVEERSSAEVVAALTERLLGSSGRAATDHGSSDRLIQAIRHFAGQVGGTVFDPACGVGSLLLALGSSQGTTLVAQELDPAAARFTSLRAAIGGNASVTIKVGDSLRNDQWPDLRATLVVCDPPVTVADWGREELLLDPRWEFGVPTRAESELAWLQHCYAHVAPGGQAVVAMPASVAYRKAGRRIRAELVRRGVIAQVVALPSGVAVSHSQPVHLWVLARPAASGPATPSVRMVDLSVNAPEGPFEPEPDQVVDVPLVDLLDEEVDLTPGRHVLASRMDHLADYLSTCDLLGRRLRELRGLLPSLTSGPGTIDGATVRMADLIRAGLVEVSDGAAVAVTDQLDTGYLNGFLRSMANAKRATSGSGSFRADVRGARVPQMSIDDQRTYGDAFRALDDFERRLADLAKLGERAASLARDGLTHGTLLPEPETPQQPRLTGDSARAQ
ncbi:N-6 DNA methylase [Amycolatopsis sp. TNS106]|uniref:N-6 DNA methylase n=1 Tax=Amycolatopsis sp. TNS106 TaxID=2861750 RepID=UPI001C580653|nr:N-6 DNA methylase [Amycolatopsis sp. TNS106]QXV61539.1 SAM-dependent methyltransferase [Amycolatopsis sp. TNS106]